MALEPLDDLLTMREVMEYLGIGYDKAATLFHRLPTVLMDNRQHLRRSDCDAVRSRVTRFHGRGSRKPKDWSKV